MDNSRRILCAAQFDNYSNRKDKTVTLKFITQEITPLEVANLHGLIDGFGYLYFKSETALSKSEIEELDALETDLIDNGRTQSKRIRNVLYRLWELNKEGMPDFKEYYRVKTEKIIEHLKGKLP